METILNTRLNLHLSKKIRQVIADFSAYLFIVLFMYTAGSKLFALKSFAATLAKSPLIGNLNIIVAWTIPLVEIILSIMLVFPQIRKAALRGSLLLMSIFTCYLIYMVYSGHELPCHCGGVISSMTWQQHIWFNLGFVALAIGGLVANKK